VIVSRRPTISALQSSRSFWRSLRCSSQRASCPRRHLVGIDSPHHIADAIFDSPRPLREWVAEPHQTALVDSAESGRGIRFDSVLRLFKLDEVFPGPFPA
jgi:hypothetical protein